MLFLFLILGLLITSCSTSSVPDKSHTMLIQEGNVLMPSGELKKLDILIKGDTIYAYANAGTKQWAADDTINADGNFVMPGFIDAHAHFIGIGKAQMQVNLLGTHTWQGLLDSIAARVKNARPGEWIIGRGWHQEKWTDKPAYSVNGFPSNKELNAVSPDNPVVLVHASGHGLLANEMAMKLAGINANTPSPEGGKILRNNNGLAIGIFQENAMNLIRSVYDSIQDSRSDEQKIQDWLKYVQLAEKVCLKYGVTSLHDAGISLEQAERFKELAQEGELDMRLYSMLSEDELRNQSRSTISTFCQSTDSLAFFTCRSVKGYMDGALGSRGAWLLDDYTDKPGYRGQNVTPVDTLLKSARIAQELGLQMCIHAIGDRANREVLDIYEEIGVSPDARWRIEHAQHLNPVDIPRFHKLGIIASMQPIHCTSDAPYVIDRLGVQRAREGAYVWKSLLDSGARLAFGTDAPVEKVDPFANLYAAITRKSPVLDTAFFPEQSVSRQKALKIYTYGNAYAEFAEDEKGSIAVGMLADIVILNKNLLNCDVNEIPDAQVLYTIVGGDLKYARKK